MSTTSIKDKIKKYYQNEQLLTLQGPDKTQNLRDNECSFYSQELKVLFVGELEKGNDVNRCFTVTSFDLTSGTIEGKILAIF